jgi:hypothetical protein
MLGVLAYVCCPTAHVLLHAKPVPCPCSALPLPCLLQLPERLAIVMGSESSGISRGMRGAADRFVFGVRVFLGGGGSSEPGWRLALLEGEERKCWNSVWSKGLLQSSSSVMQAVAPPRTEPFLVVIGREWCLLVGTTCRRQITLTRMLSILTPWHPACAPPSPPMRALVHAGVCICQCMASQRASMSG